MTEAQIQRRLIIDLERAGWYVVKLIKTTKNGIPDLICHKDGRTVYIEVKRPGQKPRPLQSYRHKELADHGILTITATDTTCLTKPPLSILTMASM